MASNGAVLDCEKEEIAPDVAQGALLHETQSHDDGKSEKDIAIDGGSRSSMEGVQASQEEPQDIEAPALTRTNTAPHSVFTKGQKRFIVFMVAWGGFFSPLSANIYFPALNTLARELHVSNSLINLTLTSYMIFQGLAPTIFGDLADMAGRRPAYVIGFIVYICANIGIALSKSYASLFILRCLQSSGSSGTIALASGVVADVATSAERGTYMGWATTGPMIAPAIGPVLGGIFAEFLGWRSIFWFLTIMAVVYLLPFAITFPETARNVVGNGTIPPQGWNMTVLNYIQQRRAQRQKPTLTRATSRESARQARASLASKRKLRWPNPLNVLKVVFQKDVSLLLFYNSIIYTAFYDVIASAPSLFEQIYKFNDLQIGLAFIPFGVGCLIAPLLNGRMIDWNYRRHARKRGLPMDRKRQADLSKFPIERTRIEIAAPLLFLGDSALLCYAWVLEVEAPLAAPLVLHFIMGVSLTGAFNALSVMLVDLFPMSPATATAANNLVRCLVGAAGTAVIIQMIDSMGRGWCFTFIALVVAVLSPILLVIIRWGPGWRAARKAKEDKKEQNEAEKEKSKEIM